MDYKLPDPEKEAFKCLVLSYKTRKGVPYDLRSWDNQHFARCTKSAKALLEICGSLRDADACLMEVSQKFIDSDLTWTLETIVKHSHDWKAKRGKTSGDAHRQRLFSEFAKQRAQIKIEGTGTTGTGGEVLPTLPSGEDIKSGSAEGSD